MPTSLVTVNGAACLRATYRLPRSGVWLADLVVDVTSAISGRVSVSVADGALTLKGTASRTGTFKDTAVLRVLAGAGGMAKTVSAKFFRGASVGTVLRHVLEAAGEQLSSTVAATLLERQLTVYTVRTQSAGAALLHLAEYLGVTWRALPDGTIWLGDEAWPEAALTSGVVLAQDPRAQTVTIGTDSPTLLPGTVWGGRRISTVEHSVRAEQIRSTLWLEPTGATGSGLGDRLTQAVRSIVRSLTSHMDYFAVYPAKVVSQNADGTLELQPDDQRIPGLTKVPIRYGIPGVTAKVASGARVNVHFEGGDPGSPMAALWQSGTLNEVTVTAATKVTVSAPTIEADAGASGTVTVKGGTINLGDPATDAALKGTTYTNAETVFLTALSAYVTGIAAVADPSGGTTPAFSSAITAFVSSLSTSLSQKVKVG